MQMFQNEYRQQNDNSSFKPTLVLQEVTNQVYQTKEIALVIYLQNLNQI